MNTKIILFSHHKVDELTINRFNLVKRLNPTWDVVSVGFRGYDLLPNSLFVNREIYPKNKELVEIDNLHTEDWSNPDFFLYSGYSFNNLHSYGQSTCIYFKNHILKKCTEEILKNKSLYDNMLSEIRGGTLVSQFTFLKSGRDDIEKYISWTVDDINIDTKIPHFYHPYKYI